jgi:peptide/nickel transport system substrate-binding protein
MDVEMRRFFAAGLAIAVAFLPTSSRSASTLRVGAISQPNSLNPLLSSLQIEQYVFTAVFSGLIGVDERTRPFPDLALEVPTKANGGISPDGRTITYHLRPDVKWQDGVALTADDVVFSYQKFVDPKGFFPNRSRYDDIVASMESKGPQTVVVHLKKAAPDAVLTLFVSGNNGSVVPKHLLEHEADLLRSPFNGAPVGSGPYSVLSWNRGTGITLRANPTYYRGPPPIDTIELKFVPDGNTLTLGMKTGATDLIYDTPPATLPMLAGAEHVKIVRAPEDSVQWLILNTTTPPLDDVAVRQAFSLAIDRPQIAANIFHGYANPALGMIAPWQPYGFTYEHDAKPDFVAAGALLERQGWKLGPAGVREKNGKRLTITLTTVAGSPTRQGMALLYQASLRSIGVDLQIRSLPINKLFATDGVFAKGDFEIGMAGFAFSPTPDRSNLLASSSIPTVGFNYGRYRSAEMDAILQAAAVTEDGPARAEIFKHFAAVLARDRPFVPLVWIVQPMVVSDALEGFKPGPDNGLFWNVWEWRLK